MMKRILFLILPFIVLYASPNLGRVQAFGEPCSNAPVPRLHEGIEAIVAPNVGPLNMRALPAVSTGIEVQLYSGTALVVLSGPSCNGDYNWWRVEAQNGSRGWVAEGEWDRYWIVSLQDVESPVDPLQWTCLSRFALRGCLQPAANDG